MTFWCVYIHLVYFHVVFCLVLLVDLIFAYKKRGWGGDVGGFRFKFLHEPKNVIIRNKKN